MHFLPILLIPVMVWVWLHAKSWGLFSETPVDPEARLAYWASQALAKIKLEILSSDRLEVEIDRLRLSKAGLQWTLWSEHGKFLKQSSAAPESLGELGSEGSLRFVQEGHSLHLTVLARQGELSKELTASLPLPSPSE